MIKGFDMSYEEFVDLCILCGCDYTETVDGNAATYSIFSMSLNNNRCGPSYRF